MSQPSTSSSSPISPLMTSEIMVGVVIVLFLVFIILFCFYLYSKRYSGANPSMMRNAATTRYILHGHAAPAPRSGLHPDTLKSLPIILFKTDDSAHGVECAVCLSDLAKDEQMRVLPKCRHGFHVDCIDMWFHSHNTCPLCRAPVTLLDDVPMDIPVDNYSSSSSSSTFPANLLVWGSREGVSTNIAGMDQTGSSSAGPSSTRKTEGMLVIEIPRRRGFSSSPSSPLPESGRQETRSPMSTRMRSLRRMLSRGMFSPSPRGGEVEERGGEGVVRSLRTPMNV